MVFFWIEVLHLFEQIWAKIIRNQNDNKISLQINNQQFKRILFYKYTYDNNELKVYKWYSFRHDATTHT